MVSVEPMGDNPVSHGIDAVRAKSAWWTANHEVHSVQVEGPYVNADQFTVRFTLDVTMKANGHRMTMDEHALYTIKDGRIAEERFFFGG